MVLRQLAEELDSLTRGFHRLLWRPLHSAEEPRLLRLTARLARKAPGAALRQLAVEFDSLTRGLQRLFMAAHSAQHGAQVGEA